MNAKPKFIALLCGMFLAVALLLTPSQAEKNSTSKFLKKKTSLSSNPFTRYRGECKGNGVYMQDITRTWFGHWYEY